MKLLIYHLAFTIGVAAAKNFLTYRGSYDHLVQREATPDHGPQSYPSGGGRGRHGCLTSRPVDSILSRWPLIFDSLYSGAALEKLINSTVTEDFTSFDGTLQQIFNVPLLNTSRADLIAQSQNSYNTRDLGPADPSGRFSKVFSFFDCDHIAFRWVFNSVTTGRTECTFTTVTEAGLPIEFYGTDLLFVRPGSLLIEKCFTSADWLVDFYAVGADFDGSPICPTVHPPNETCTG